MTVAETVPADPARSPTVDYNPSRDRLRVYARDGETATVHGAPAYVSDHRTRHPEATKNAVDDEFTERDYRLVREAVEETRRMEMICLDRQLGRHPKYTVRCRLYVPTAYARIALSIATLLEPASHDDPDFVTVQLPDRDEVAIRVLPGRGLTAVLGSDYNGEAKKSFLRLFMYRAKQQGGLGLHAGSKRLRLWQDMNGFETVGQLFLGLSGTGKTTLTTHDLRLETPECAKMCQDDVVALTPDGTAAGSEGRGIYAKSNGLSPDEHPKLHDAATDESAVLENVTVENGRPVFDSDDLTANGRVAIDRNRLLSAAPDIDLDTVDQVFFITRSPLMPAVTKLEPTEAAAAFVLGESVRTSAAGEDAAGETVREVGTNPFLIGSPGEEGNRFLDLVESIGADSYLLNTGMLGGRVDICVETTVTLVRSIGRENLDWMTDRASGLTVPRSVPGMHGRRLSPSKYVENYGRKLAALREDRREYLSSFDDLREDIVDAVY